MSKSEINLVAIPLAYSLLTGASQAIISHQAELPLHLLAAPHPSIMIHELKTPANSRLSNPFGRFGYSLPLETLFLIAEVKSHAHTGDEE
jgi:hypothetical protein